MTNDAGNPPSEDAAPSAVEDGTGGGAAGTSGGRPKDPLRGSRVSGVWIAVVALGPVATGSYMAAYTRRLDKGRSGSDVPHRLVLEALYEFHGWKLGLLETADVFLENFRDGQLEKQGLGAEQLRQKYPHLIVTGHKGFLSGPYEHRPALDEVMQMMSGLAAMTGTMDKPQRVGSSANDIMGGMFGAISILAALYQKRGGAKDGADIRIGLFENCLFLVAQHMVEYEMTGNKPRSMPEREHAWPIYDIFDTAGEELIFIGVVTECNWRAFCKEFGLQEFLDDPELRTTTDRILARSRILPRVAEEIKRWNVAELSERLDLLNICFSPINRPEDLLSDPHVLRPGGLVQNVNADGKPFRVPALPVEWNGGNIGEGLKVPSNANSRSWQALIFEVAFLSEVRCPGSLMCEADGFHNRIGSVQETAKSEAGFLASLNRLQLCRSRPHRGSSDHNT